jgi:hypothetical protein
MARRETLRWKGEGGEGGIDTLWVMEGPFPLASAATKAASTRAAQRVIDRAEVMINSC